MPGAIKKSCDRPGCGEPIELRKNQNDKWTPINPEPDPEGTVRLLGDGAIAILFDEEALARAQSQHQPLYRLHFDTCIATRE